MSFSKLLSVAASVIAGMLFAVPMASADTYQIFDLGKTFPFSEIYGIDSSGDVVLQLLGISPMACSPGANCFAITYHGVVTSYTDSVPQLDYDNSGVCNHPPINLGFHPSICNNGRVAISGKDFGYGIWTGPDPLDGPAPFADLAQIFDQPVPITLIMNGRGDIAFSTGFENYVAYDLNSIPEPNTLVLLGTGVLAAVGALRRRF